MESFSVTSDGPGQTKRIAAVVAGKLAAGDAVLLTGGLAAGKTTFVKAAAVALGSTDLVTSPTFSLAQFYSGAMIPIMHVDAYRLADVAEYRDLALDEYAEESISLIEWGEKVSADFPCHLTIAFQQGNGGTDSRVLTFASACERWTAVLGSLLDQLRQEVR